MLETEGPVVRVMLWSVCVCVCVCVCSLLYICNCPSLTQRLYPRLVRSVFFNFIFIMKKQSKGQRSRSNLVNVISESCVEGISSN